MRLTSFSSTSIVSEGNGEVGVVCSPEALGEEDPVIAVASGEAGPEAVEVGVECESGESTVCSCGLLWSGMASEGDSVADGRVTVAMVPARSWSCP